MRSRIQGLGIKDYSFRVWGLMFGVYGSGIRI